MAACFSFLANQATPSGEVAPRKKVKADPMAAVTETTHEAAPTESQSTEALTEQICKEIERFRACCDELESPDKWTCDDVLSWYKTVGSKLLVCEHSCGS